MEQADLAFLPLVLGLAGGLVALGTGLYLAIRRTRSAREAASRLLAEAARDGENRQREITVAAQERALAGQEEIDKREHEIEEREAALEQRGRKLDQQASAGVLPEH